MLAQRRRRWPSNTSASDDDVLMPMYCNICNVYAIYRTMFSFCKNRIKSQYYGHWGEAVVCVHVSFGAKL